VSDLDATSTRDDATQDEPTRRDVSPPSPDPQAGGDASVAIRVRDLHISYRSVIDKRQTLRGRINRLGRRREADTAAVKVVKAVRGVSFDVARGEVLGVVGHNGAGKSTLLRGIAGILAPDEGRVEVAGHVSTLLALGVGFNNKLTGRENILLGGLAAGLSRQEIGEIEESIIDFSGVREFIDMPLRTYSSGMRGRLAFAVSTSLDPDILLIDEALSAGDADFRDQAADRMRELLGEGRTIVLVSHSINSVEELSDRVLWLAKGRIVELGRPDDVLTHYRKQRTRGSVGGTRG
jgi:teichoic acid transport system ATP-binding protein